MDCDFQNLFTDKLIKMNYAIFCYREDYKCLELCVKQIRRADCNARIYLFDDGARPLEPGQIPAGKDVSYKVTYFPRRGNLNGLECVRGILGCMLDIPGKEPVVKIDADTLLMDKAEIVRSLKERNKLAGGMQCAEPLAWSGCCYWMTRAAMRDALELLAQREWPEGKQKYPEDVTISQIVAYLYGREGVDMLEFRGGRHLIGVRTCDPSLLVKIAEIAKSGVCAAHCGQMSFYRQFQEQYGETLREACARVIWWILHASGPDSKTFEKAPEG